MDDLLKLLNAAMRGRNVEQDTKPDSTHGKDRFKVKITDLSTGEVEVDTVTDIVLLVHHEVESDCTASTQLMACSLSDSLCAMRGLHNLLNQLAEKLLKKSPQLALMIALRGGDNNVDELLKYIGEDHE